MEELRVARSAQSVPARKTLVIAVALAVLLSMLTAARSNAGPSAYTWAAGLPGCDASRPAVAHTAGQQLLSPQPKDGPVPCGMLTGWPAGENRIEVTNTGAVIFIPAQVPAAPGVSGKHEGLARSTDDGRAWNAFTVEEFPGSDYYPLVASIDHNLYVDHDGGRLFAYFDNPLGLPPLTAAVGGATIAFSDDSGTTWSVGNDIDHTSAENPTILTGAPLPGIPSPAGYPNVIYLCGDNTSTGVGGAGTAGFSCSKSLTGGRTWRGTTRDGQGFYSGVAKDNLDPYPECAGASSSAGAGVQPLRDGSLLVTVACGGKNYLSKSTDEGATWNVVQSLQNDGSLRVDSEDNLYLLRKATDATGSSELLLSNSTDGGTTWSPELNMVAPDVKSVGTFFFVQGTYADGQVGHVAVAYYGIRAEETTSDGFITETRDALDATPVFWSGQVNSPTRPLLYNTPGEFTRLQPAGILDFNGGALSPDGNSAWGSFVQSCGTHSLEDPNCQSRWPQHANPDDPTDGFAGRLVWPSGANR